MASSSSETAAVVAPGMKATAMDVMMLLEGEALTNVYTAFKRVFDAENRGLSSLEFVDVVLEHLPQRFKQELDTVELVVVLRDIFAQVRVRNRSCLLSRNAAGLHALALWPSSHGDILFSKF